MFIWNRWRHLVLRLEVLEQRVRDLEFKVGVFDRGLKLDETGRVTAVDASHIQGLGPHPFVSFVTSGSGGSSDD